MTRNTERGARISSCGRYRYTLHRTWGAEPPLAFLMLNPSTADADVDDPTIRRCIGFARRDGFGGIVVVNLYAYRATDPRQLWAQTDPVGPENDEAIVLECASRHVVCAWGVHARNDRVLHVAGLLHTYGAHTYCLGLTAGGPPRHPLYIRGDQPLAPWRYMV